MQLPVPRSRGFLRSFFRLSHTELIGQTINNLRPKFHTEREPASAAPWFTRFRFQAIYCAAMFARGCVNANVAAVYHLELPFTAAPTFATLRCPRPPSWV